MAAHQALPSLGFSRQEHWSGLPFLSPVHESEKWKWSLSVMSDSATPWTAAHQAPPSMGFSRQKYLGLNLKITPLLLLLYIGSVKLQVKVKVTQLCPTLYNSPWNSPGQNTGVDSLSLLEGIFATQGSNPGLPHCSRFFTIWATREAQEYWSR